MEVVKSIKKNWETYEFVYSKENEILTFNKEKGGELIALLKEENIECDSSVKDVVRIETDNFPYNFFYDEDEFLNKVNLLKLDKGVVILNSNSNHDSRCYIENKGYFNFELISNNYFKNYSSYFSLIDFLESKSLQGSSAFDFVDYYDGSNGGFVFAVPNEYGKAVVSISSKAPVLDDQINYSLTTEKFFSVFDDDNKNYPVFVKNEIVRYLALKEEKYLFTLFFKELNNILKKAELNHNVFLSGLSIDELKKEYREYKEKYLDELSSLLGKMSNKIIALPITILSATFAINKVSGSISALLIIASAIVIISGFLVFILRLHKQDLIHIKDLVDKDFNRIKSNNFFGTMELPKNREELVDFKLTKDKIDKRIKTLQGFVVAYYVLMSIFNIILLLYIAYEITPLLYENSISIEKGGLLVIVLAIISLVIYYIALNK